MGTLFTDVRHAIRGLVRNPGFLLAAAGTLALGIAVNVPVFAFSNALLFRPLPVPNGERLTVFARERKDSGPVTWFSPAEYQTLRANQLMWNGVVAISAGQFTAVHDGISDRVTVNFVSDNYWDALGLSPVVGQLFRSVARDRQLDESVVVLSHGFWRDRFAADGTVVGKPIVLGGSTVVVVGVAPPNFHGDSIFSDVQAFLPLGAPGFGADRRPVRVLGFLKPGISLRAANASLAGMSTTFALQRRESPSDVRLRAFWERFARPDPGAASTQLMGATFFGILALFVLALAAVNTANLVLIRVNGRSTEIAVRRALGANATRLLLYLFAETVAVVAFGAALGLSGGYAMLRAFIALSPSAYAPLLQQIAFDWRAAAFLTSILLATTLVVGTWPAFRALRVVAVSDKLSTRTGTSGRSRVRTGLMMAQVACAVMLLTVAGVFARTLSASHRPAFGFDPVNVFNVSMNPAEGGDGGRHAVERVKEIVAGVSSLPGVEAASLTQCVPLAPHRNSIATIYTDQQSGDSSSPPAEYVGYCSVLPNYFETLRIGMLVGRPFLASDLASTPRVGIISHTMAEKYWPNRSALGASFRLNGPSAPLVQVIGIVADIMNYSSTQQRTPFFYLPLEQHPTPNITLQVRSSLPAVVLAQNVSTIIRSTAPDIVPFDAQTFSSAIADAPTGLLLPRLGALLATVFGSLGLLLSVVGVYGVVAYGASQRTRELALRMALGATQSDIRFTVIKTGLIVVVGGITIGLGSALLGARVAAGVYPGVRLSDPLTFAAAAAVVGLSALVACYIPARRAMRVDPATLLRQS